MMKLHGAATMTALFFIGSVAATHVIRGWRLHQRLGSGVAMLALAALLVLSGYSLYYWVPETWRSALGWAHALVGACWALTLWWHRRHARSVANT
jgi:hypothetical protein